VKTIIALAVIIFAVALGFLLGVRYANDESRRFIIRGEELQF